MAPFCEFFPLVILDGDFDLPQHLFTDLTDCAAQDGSGLGRIEVKDGHEIDMLIPGIRFQTASGQHHIGCAGNRRFVESKVDVFFIIPIQKGTVNDVENVLLMGIPIIVHQESGDMFQQIREADSTADFKAIFQRRRDDAFMLVPVLPKERAASIFAAARVRYIEHIFQSGIIAAGIDQGNALGAAPHIAVHLFVPQLIIGAGRRIWTLGVDHQLLMVGVLIQPRSGGQKGRPLLVASGYLLRCVVCHLRVKL